MARYYRSDSYVSHTDRKKTLLEKIYHRVKRYMEKKKTAIIQKHSNVANARLLDYGCGTGDFVVAAQNHGFIAKGYEPDQRAVEVAKQKGIDVLSKEEEIIPTRGSEYDVVCMWHVMEHIHNHNEVLINIHKVLKQKGLLVIAVPMATSYDALYYREFWAAWDVPRHLWHFTPDTLKETCKKHGFQLLAKYAMPFDGFYISMISEQYRKSSSLMVLGRGLAIGLLSNLQALAKRRPASSELFVFSKQDDHV